MGCAHLGKRQDADAGREAGSLPHFAQRPLHLHAPHEGWRMHRMHADKPTRMPPPPHGGLQAEASKSMSRTFLTSVQSPPPETIHSERQTRAGCSKNCLHGKLAKLEGNYCSCHIGWPGLMHAGRAYMRGRNA